MRWCCLLWVLWALPLAAQGLPENRGDSPQQLLAQFDADRTGRLNATERRAAIAFLLRQPEQARRRMPAAPAVPLKTGRRLTPADVRRYPSVPFFADSVLRTIFLDFEDADWEKQLELFRHSDVEVAATVTIDGVRYRDVGVRFRGLSSYFTVHSTRKRSLNLSLDWGVKSQTVQGFRTLNLLNNHEDPTFLHTVLFNRIARRYFPAPQSNLVRVVINSESWGLYASVEQFNKDFIREWFGTTNGARWKVPGEPRARGGLEYLGDAIAPYRVHYEIKSKDDPAAWQALIHLTRVLNTTPADKLEATLTPVLDVDGVLRLLALEVVLANNDGYWSRGSDYDLYRDPNGRFHLFPQDANETFPIGHPAGGGMSQGREDPASPPDVERGGPALDPMVSTTDATKPLRSRLLAVPALRARYLAYVREMATTRLDWRWLGPIVARYDALIAADVKADTKKLYTDARYVSGLAELQAFATKRRDFLLGWRAR